VRASFAPIFPGATHFRICPAHRMSPDRLRSPSRARDLPSKRLAAPGRNAWQWPRRWPGSRGRRGRRSRYNCDRQIHPRQWPANRRSGQARDLIAHPRARRVLLFPCLSDRSLTAVEFGPLSASRPATGLTILSGRRVRRYACRIETHQDVLELLDVRRVQPKPLQRTHRPTQPTR
jgi:hypothetical protein